MLRKSIFCFALASLALATSCSQDELKTSPFSNSEIKLHATLGDTPGTRAEETTITNLEKFKVYAFIEGQANYMDNVEYTSSDNGSTWSTTAGTFYWPTSESLNLYCYSPETPGKSGTLTLDKTGQTLAGFSPNDAAADQKDFVYAKATGSADKNGTGIEINFQHALSEITVSAKNSNTAYNIEVSGVKIGNVKNKGTFTFPSVDGKTTASWALEEGTTDYTTTWTTATTLDANASTMDDANVAFMILPQQLTKQEKASTGNYIALKIKLTSQGGSVVYDDWAYVGINTLWEMGNRYDYTLDFSEGAGQKPDGTLIISNQQVTLNVKVTNFEGNSYVNNEKVEEGAQ